MRCESIYERVCVITRRALGVAVNPHLFRDSLATSLAVHDPERIRSATALLGHGSVETTNRHYNQAKVIDAVRRYHSHIGLLRRRLGHEAGGERKRRQGW